MEQKKAEKTNKYVYLDILRAIAVLLVIYAHFISVGMHAPEIPFIISSAKLTFIVLVSFVLITTLAIFTHVFIEKPGISLGRFFVRKLKEKNL